MRSVINNAIKKKGIEEFYDNSTDIIRDTVLGISDGTTERPGLLFKENGMRIYDVEVLNVKITDSAIDITLVKAQRDVVSQTLDLAARRRELEAVKEKEKISQDIAVLRNATKIEDFKLAIKETEEGLKAKISKLEADLAEKNKDIEINSATLEKEKNNADQEIEINTLKQKLEIERIKEETEKVVSILKAIQPELIATLKTMSNQELAKVLAQNLPKAAGSFGLLTNKGGIESVMNMVKGTPLEDGLAALLGVDQNKGEKLPLK